MKLTKTQQLTAILSVLCLLAAANSAFAATASTYVGVKAGDIFEYTLTVTGTSASNPWPGTYDWTLTIDNVTDKGDYTTIDVTMVIKNATWKTNNLSDYSQVSESDTKIVGYISVYVINKNIANKSYNDRQEEGSVVEWANATWDANGVLEKRSILFGNSGGYSLEALSRKGIPGYPTLFLVAFTAVAVGLIVKKKLRSGAS